MTEPVKIVDRKIALVVGDFWLDRLEKETGEPRNNPLLLGAVLQDPACAAILNDYRHGRVALADLPEMLEPSYPSILERYKALIADKREREGLEQTALRKDIERELKKTKKRSKDKPA